MAKKKMSILDFKKYKEEGRKFTYVTAYDYTMASIINDSETEVILVGDSLGMIMLGYDGTEAVTMEDMIHHTKSVVKGRTGHLHYRRHAVWQLQREHTAGHSQLHTSHEGNRL